MIDTLRSSLMEGFKNWKPILFVYAIQLLFALVFGIQVFQILKESIGNSLAMQELVYHFDYTVVIDILHTHKKEILNIFMQLRWQILLWIICSVYLNAGLIYSAIDNSNTFSFFRAANKYFIPFLKIAFLFFGLAIIWFFVILLPLLLNLEFLLSYFNSEKYVLIISFLCISLFLIGLLFLYNWSVVSRIKCINNQEKISIALKKSGIFVMWNKRKLFLFYISIITIQIVIWVICKSIDSQLNSSSWLLVIAGIILQQLIIFNSIQCRLVFYIGLGKLNSIQ